MQNPAAESATVVKRVAKREVPIKECHLRGAVAAAKARAKRDAKVPDVAKHQIGMGREMFAGMRSTLTGAEQGACSLFVGQD